MASTHSGIPDTNRTSGPMRPFLQNRAGRPAGAIALPATSPQPTEAASPSPGTIPTPSPVPVAVPGHPTTVHPVGRPPKLLDRLAEALRARHLPIVMTREEGKAVLRCLDGSKWVMASLLYGAGSGH